MFDFNFIMSIVILVCNFLYSLILCCLKFHAQQMRVRTTKPPPPLEKTTKNRGMVSVFRYIILGFYIVMSIITEVINFFILFNFTLFEISRLIRIRCA